MTYHAKPKGQTAAQRQARQRKRNKIKQDAGLDLHFEVDFLVNEYTGKNLMIHLKRALKRYDMEIESTKGI